MNFFQLGLSFSGFSVPLITELFILIDWGIYSIACAALQGFFEILQVSYELFGSSSSEGWEKAHAIMKRIMALGGVYALFRVGIMMINYLIDPSKLSDAQKTGTKIIKNIFIAAVLLLSSSFIFQKLGEFQRLVFESNLIENIIYGENGENNKKTIKEKAKSFTNKTWQLFFTKIEGKNDAECSKNYALVSQGQAEIRVLIGCHYKYYDYFPIAPFIVGILLIYYFVVYSIELGSRMIKLLVLEILSPIPIIMSIDPSSKNNLNNFVKTYIPIYLQVFLRVITLYMALALCNIVLGELQSSISSGTLLFEINDLSFFLKIIVIIGIFQGAKELPKLVQEALGFKFGSGPGNFTGALKGIVGGTAGFIGGTVAGAVTGGVGGAVAGGLRGGYSGAKDGYHSKNWGDNISKTVSNIGRSGALGKGFHNAGGMMPFIGGSIANKFGAQNRHDKTIDDYKKAMGKADKQISNVNRSAELRERLNSTINDEFTRQYGNLEELMSKDPNVRKWEEAIAINQSNGFYQQDESYREYDLQQLQAAKDKVQQNYENSRQVYFNEQINLANSDRNDLSDDTKNIQRELHRYNSFNEENGISNREISNYGDMSRISNLDADQIVKYEDQIRDLRKQQKDFENSNSVKASKAAAEYKKRK